MKAKAPLSDIIKRVQSAKLRRNTSIIRWMNENIEEFDIDATYKDPKWGGQYSETCFTTSSWTFRFDDGVALKVKPDGAVILIQKCGFAARLDGSYITISASDKSYEKIELKPDMLKDLLAFVSAVNELQKHLS